jgi:hypothetical protein
VSFKDLQLVMLTPHNLLTVVSKYPFEQTAHLTMSLLLTKSQLGINGAQISLFDVGMYPGKHYWHLIS